jgi:chromosome partitioning protein
MNEKTIERIKELQNSVVLSDEKKKEVKNEIISIIKKCSVDEIRELMNNETKTHAITIQKGGVGKSTAASDICYILAKLGFTVLGIDSDPQASFSMLCNTETEDEEICGLQDIYTEYVDSFEERRPFDPSIIHDAICRPTYIKPARVGTKWEEKEFEFGYDFIPANIDLAGFDLELAKPGRAYVLRNVLNTILENKDGSFKKYDFIIIDCLPGLNAISYAAICGAYSGGCIVPINLEPMTVKGAKNLIETTSEIQHLLWEKNKIVHKGILGIIKNQYSPRMSIQRQFDEVVKELFPISTFENFIPNKTACDKAHALGRAFAEYDPKVGEIMTEICYEIIAEDIRRNNEKEPLFVDEFGVKVWDEYNE